MLSIFDFTLSELEEYFLSIGEKKYRALQVFSEIHKRRQYDFLKMSSLPENLREKLSKEFSSALPNILKKLVSKDKTIKYLFEFSDKTTAEAVFMHYDGKNNGTSWNSICVSTQCGCKMGCKFCASSRVKFTRNFTPGEILSQIYAAEDDLNENVSSAVLMGIGEPLDNFFNTIKFINIITTPKGRAMGNRHITISTCGLVPEIRKLADMELKINLSISLHSVCDSSRTEIMPINKKYNIKELLESAKYYFEKTGRRISFEFALIEGENDDIATAKKLAALIKPLSAHINIIPLNKISDFSGKKSKNALLVREILNKEGVVATVRRTLGEDIEAACGQLRIREIKIDKLEEKNN